MGTIVVNPSMCCFGWFNRKDKETILTPFRFTRLPPISENVFYDALDGDFEGEWTFTLDTVNVHRVLIKHNILQQNNSLEKALRWAFYAANRRTFRLSISKTSSDFYFITPKPSQYLIKLVHLIGLTVEGIQLR